MKKLGIVFAVAMGLGGCVAGDEELAMSSASVELGAFTDEAVAARLGAGWTRVEAGVLERHGDDGSVQRVAAGRRGFDADIARWRAELDRREAAPDRPATAAAEAYLEALRTRIADLEALRVRKDAQVYETSGCWGDEFFAQGDAYEGYSSSSIDASAGWSIGFSPRVPSQTYAYANVWNGFWPSEPPSEELGDSYNPASASKSTPRFNGCSLSAYAWVSPSCEGAYLSIENHANCSINPF